MEIKEANVFKVGALKSGVSQQGTPWKKQEYVIEFYENPTDMWSQKIVIALMNDSIEKYNLQEGDKVSLRCSLIAREYNGNFYQEVIMAKDTLKVLKRMSDQTQQ